MKNNFKACFAATLLTLLLLMIPGLLSRGRAEAWSPLDTGMTDVVYCLAYDPANNHLYAGGNFTNAGGVLVNRIARWDGSSWSPLGSGMNDHIRALALDGAGSLYAGGGFTAAGGVLVNKIARWDGSSWSALSTGVNRTVFALAHDGAGNLYAGGSFTVPGVPGTRNIARWDGSSWQPLGAGLNKVVYALAFDGAGNLYAGGGFTTAGGVTVNRVAKWDGQTWSALGMGLNQNVNDLVFGPDGSLYAGGRFTGIGGKPANHVARWDGSSWSALGEGMGGASNPLVNALAFDGAGNLYAGGRFSLAGGTPANNIARWDGSSWSALGTGLNQAVHDLVFSPDGSLHAGGSFTSAGGERVGRIARWSAPGPKPSISPFVNSLGMEFLPAPGTDVLFAKYETRVKDFRAFVADGENNDGYDYRNGEQPWIWRFEDQPKVEWDPLLPDRPEPQRIIRRRYEWKQVDWEYGWSNPGFYQLENHPVTCVSRGDAEAFCRWLTKKERAEGKIGQDREYRLPLSWEWSLAVGLKKDARGRPIGPRAGIGLVENVYPWDGGAGTWPPPRWRAGNYAGEEREVERDESVPKPKVIEGYRDDNVHTSPVGLFEANAHGLYDLGGNVWEWCGDQAYTLRGASWQDFEPTRLLSSSSHQRQPGKRSERSRYSNYGFRVVLGPSSP